MKVTKMRLGIFMLFTIMTNAWAAELYCGGKVTYLAMHANDRFMVQLESMDNPVFFCNAQTTWSVSGAGYTTGPETCKMLYSSLLAAKTSGTAVGTLLFDGAEVPANCKAWGSWKTANIRYMYF